MFLESCVWASSVLKPFHHSSHSTPSNVCSWYTSLNNLRNNRPLKTKAHWSSSAVDPRPVRCHAPSLWNMCNPLLNGRAHARCDSIQRTSDRNPTIVAVTKLHAPRSRQNHTLQHEQRSPGEWRQLRTRSVTKRNTVLVTHLLLGLSSGRFPINSQLKFLHSLTHPIAAAWIQLP
jgi:hypothetical protein